MKPTEQNCAIQACSAKPDAAELLAGQPGPDH